MVITINIINVTEKTPQFLGLCNLTLDATVDEQTILNAFKEILPRVFKIGKARNMNMADLMNLATSEVLKKYPGTILLDVNENRTKANPALSLKWNLSKK